MSVYLLPSRQGEWGTLRGAAPLQVGTASAPRRMPCPSGLVREEKGQTEKTVAPLKSYLESESISRSIVSYSSVTLWTVALHTPLSMGFSGKNTEVGCHFLLQGIFPTQESNPGLLHCKQILYCLSQQEKLP